MDLHIIQSMCLCLSSIARGQFDFLFCKLDTANHPCLFVYIPSVWFLIFVLAAGNFNRHEAELAAAASQPLPDDDDDAFE